MDIVILGLLAVLAIPVGLILLWVRVSGMRRDMAAMAERLARAEARLVAVEAGQPSPWTRKAAAAEAAPAVQSEAVESQVEAPEAVIAEAVAASIVPEAAPDMPPSLPPGPRPKGLVERFGAWLGENWVYAVSGVSLALAGVFLVQYGIERGFLPPALRVLAGIGFGLGLIYAGERVRRRFGDGEESSTAYLPSVFSGAGLVSVFAAVLAARQMYGLIGPEVTFAALVATAGGAILLGWFHGPLLAALGLVGATLSPFVVGGNADSVDWLQGYFLLVAGVGLAVDAMRRWAWVSGLSVGLALAAGFLLVVGGGSVEALQMAVTVLALLAVGVPALRLFPDHAGPTVLTVSLIQKGGGRPIFPVLLGWAAVAAGVALLVLLFPAPGWGMLPFVLLALLGIVLALWTGQAPGLHDLPLLPAAGFVALVAFAPEQWGHLFRAFEAAAERPPETAAPWTVTWLMLLAAGVSCALAWRAQRGAAHPVILSIAAALAAPMTALVLELTWPVSGVVGAYPWALQVMALAPLMATVAAYVGPILGLGAALWLLPREGRDAARAFAESGVALALVLLADVLLLRWISGGAGRLPPEAHWAAALLVLPWLAMALVQLYRVKLGGRLTVLRYGLAGVAGVIWGLGMLVAVTVLNPLVWGDLVRGPLVLDSLFVAYGLTGGVILLARRWLGHLPVWLRRGMDGIGAALVALYAGLEIRRFWRGDDLSVPGTSQPELYSYTIALLIVGAVLLWQAIARNSVGLRRVALGLIGLTVAKVFLVDAAGLSGLMRVFSFLALGLSLAGLAWLNRWAAGRAAK